MAPPYTTVELVTARLRLGPADVDAERLGRCVDAANELVDRWLARLPGTELVAPFPGAVVEAASGTAVRVYRFKDVDVDAANEWGGDTGLRVPRDPLAGYVDLLAPYRAGAAWCPA